jgi:hypothetical protein
LQLLSSSKCLISRTWPALHESSVIHWIGTLLSCEKLVQTSGRWKLCYNNCHRLKFKVLFCDARESRACCNLMQARASLNHARACVLVLSWRSWNWVNKGSAFVDDAAKLQSLTLCMCMGSDASCNWPIVKCENDTSDYIAGITFGIQLQSMIPRATA